MSLIDQAKALLELAEKRTRTGPLRQGNTEPFVVWIKDPNALGGQTLGERLLLRFNQHIPFDADVAYLVAVWDLAEVLAREYISVSETVRCCARALGRETVRRYEAEDIARAVLTAGLSAVEAEREACARIAGDPTLTADEAARRIRGRGQ